MSTATETHPCVDCGDPVERELPTGFGREFLLAALRCDDCATRLEDTEAQRDRDREAQYAADLVRRRLDASGIPAALRGLPAALRGLDWGGMHPQATAAAKTWAADGGGLVLTGPVGVGKTHLAATAARHALPRRGCHWLSAPLLFARLGSGLGSEQRDRALDVLTGRTALVIDDLDKARPTEYGAEHVFLAVDGRITNNAPLLVTTNLSLAELAAKFPEPYGEAVASRLAGYCQVVRLTGPDQRTRS